MDEPLANAYHELVASVSAPPDAMERVSARRAQRRRRRHGSYTALGGAAVCAGLVAVLTFGGDGSTPTPAEDPNATGTDAPGVPATPTAVTCEGGADPQTAYYDHSGYDSFTEMLTKQAETNGAYTVDRSSRTIYFLRADRTAHAAVPWAHAPGSRWFPEGKTSCPDQQEWRGLSLDASGPSAPVSLEVGHCWVEPVELAGRTWEVIEEDQFGSGGRVPGRFTGAGTAWLTGDVLSYVDDDGARLTLVPEGDPWAVERGLCD